MHDGLEHELRALSAVLPRPGAEATREGRERLLAAYRERQQTPPPIGRGKRRLRRPATFLAVAVVSGALGYALAASGIPLRFINVTHGSTQPAVSGEHVRKAWAEIVPSINYVGGAALTKQDVAHLEAIHYMTHFAIGVIYVAPTSGYSVSVKRITLQRISRTKRQFCVIAAINGPATGQPVVQRAFYADQFVKLSSRRFRIDQLHWAIPMRWVLRSTSGKLLGVSVPGGAPSGVWPGTRPDARPGLCRV
jgi:hypothetical protein